MKTRHTLIAILLIIVLVVCSGCSNNQADHYDDSTTTEENIPEDLRPEIRLSDYALEWRISQVENFRIAYPYVSTVAFDEETRKMLEAIPEKLKIYQNTFNVEIKSPTEETDLLLIAAVSDDVSNRLKVAQRADCPDELIVKIAAEEPDPLVRSNAIGNILDRRDFPVEYLVELAKSEYSNSRYAAVVHDNRTTDVIAILIEDPVPLVRDEAQLALGIPT